MLVNVFSGSKEQVEAKKNRNEDLTMSENDELEVLKKKLQEKKKALNL